MKKTSILVLLLSSLAACGQVSSGQELNESVQSYAVSDSKQKEKRKLAESHHYHICTWESRSLEEWVRRKPAILTGKVIEVSAKLPGRDVLSNACWAKFSVHEWLKSNGEKEIWVKSVIDQRNKSYEDFESLRYCEFEEGGNYLVLGDYVRKSKLKVVSSWVRTATPKGAINETNCPPNTQLNRNMYHSIIKQVRQYLAHGDVYE